MAKYNNKYLVVQTISNMKFFPGDVVAQVAVTKMDKYDIGKEWGKLEVKYPKTHYIIFISETNDTRREFQDEPKIN
jgi:hypothetical protein